MGYNKIPLALGFNDSTGNASGLVEFTLNLSDVGDVCGGEAGTGQALVRNADGEWCPSTLPAPGAFNGNLSDVGQVCSATPSNGQVLAWSGAANVWCASTIPTGGGGGAVNSVNTQTGDVSLYLSSLSGVDTSDLQTDHHIVYDADSTNWVSQYSQKLFLIASNQTGVNLSKGAVVYVSGATLGADPEIALALANSSATMPSIGVIHETISNTQTGPVITFGTALGLTFDDTLTTADIGKTVYVSPTNAGQVTVTKPTGSTNLIQNVGVLVDDSPVKVKVTGVGRANDIPVNVDVVGSATIGTNNIFTQTDAQLDGTTASELVLTDSSNKISSVASATLFAGARLQDLKDTTDTDPANRTLIQRNGTTWVYRTLSEVQTNSDTAGRIDLGGLGNVDDSDSPPLDIPEAQTLLYDRSTGSYVVSALKHSTLSGLGDDDHTQYVLSAGTRAMSALTVTTDITASTVSATDVSADGLCVNRVGQGRPTKYRWETDYLVGGVTQNGWGSHTNGAGAGIGADGTAMIDSTDYGVGVLGIRTGTATLGRASMTRFDGVFQASSIGISASFRLTVQDLWVAGTSEGYVIVGIANNGGSGTKPLRGLYFRYDETSTDWQAIATTAFATETVSGTGVAVTEEAFQVLQIIVDENWTKAQYFIDGNLVATMTLADGHEIPQTPGELMGFQVKIVNTNGGPGNDIWIDWSIIEMTIDKSDRGENYIKAGFV
jgi:hypothetical protein